jgi:hypothetical protein
MATTEPTPPSSSRAATEAMGSSVAWAVWQASRKDQRHAVVLQLRRQLRRMDEL